MESGQHLEALGRDGAGFADALAGIPMDAPVPSCPGWDVADLWWHLAGVHHFWCTVVHDHLTDWESYARPQRPDDAALPAWYRGGLERLLTVLASAQPSDAAWTWSADQSVGFVRRRMAQETAVHRLDAELAAGRPGSVEAELASDGIDELLTLFIDHAAEGAAPVDGSVHIHCTDVAGEWTVRESPDGFVVSREHAKGDCALRGPASDLLLVLWRRAPLSTIDVVGDADVAARFVAHAALR